MKNYIQPNEKIMIAGGSGMLAMRFIEALLNQVMGNKSLEVNY